MVRDGARAPPHHEERQPSDRPSATFKQRCFSPETASAPAILRESFERLGKPLQRKGVGGLGALGGYALDGHIRGLAHGVHHPLFFGGVLDPEAIALSVHRIRRAAEEERMVDAMR